MGVGRADETKDRYLLIFSHVFINLKKKIPGLEFCSVSWLHSVLRSFEPAESLLISFLSLFVSRITVWYFAVYKWLIN